MNSTNREKFNIVFDELWWSVMDYEPPKTKVDIYFTNLIGYGLPVIRKSANMLIGTTERMPTLEQWRFKCWELFPKKEPDIEPEPTEREQRVGGIMRKYFAGKATAEDTYELLAAVDGIDIDKFEWLKEKSGRFEIFKPIPEQGGA